MDKGEGDRVHRFYLEVAGSIVAVAMVAAGGWFPVQMRGLRRWIVATLLIGGGFYLAASVDTEIALQTPLIAAGAFVLARMCEMHAKRLVGPFFSVSVRRGVAIALLAVLGSST